MRIPGQRIKRTRLIQAEKSPRLTVFMVDTASFFLNINSCEGCRVPNSSAFQAAPRRRSRHEYENPRPYCGDDSVMSVWCRSAILRLTWKIVSSVPRPTVRRFGRWAGVQSQARGRLARSHYADVLATWSTSVGRTPCVPDVVR